MARKISQEPAGRDNVRRRVSTTTVSGVPIEALYGPADLDGIDLETELGQPGQKPYTRGIYPRNVPEAPLDHAPVQRLRHRRRHERAFPATCSTTDRQAFRSPSICQR